MKKLVLTLAVLAMVAFPALAGEWHTGQNNLCADCHTMHNSMAHTWSGTGTVSIGTPVADGNWIKAGTTGGGNYLLKHDDPNALCLACHDNQLFAPDVLGVDKTANDAPNRSAGYLNDNVTNPHTGHSLGSILNAPGNAGGYTVDAAHGLQCINCHTQHGMPGIYRNLGPRSLSYGPINRLPHYALNGQQPVGITTAPIDLAGSVTADNIDVFIDVVGYEANTSTFAAFYDTANIKYLKRTTLIDGIENNAGNQCAACHGNFHGAVDSVNIGGEVSGTTHDKFNRHPVGGIVLGTLGGGHSDTPANRYAAATSVSKVKVYADDQTTFADATPGCISCHKGHGNGQPFGLVFANRTVAGMTEEGTMAANAAPTGAQTAEGQRALCGQCHKQGN